MRISDWSSDVCSSDLRHRRSFLVHSRRGWRSSPREAGRLCQGRSRGCGATAGAAPSRFRSLQPLFEERARAVAFEHRAVARSEEHTSELQSLMRISYAVFCLKKKKTRFTHTTTINH